MKILLLSLFVSYVLITTPSCQREKAVDFATKLSTTSQAPAPQTASWSSDPTNNPMYEIKGLKSVWTEFVRTYPYSIAQPADRILSAGARYRVNSGGPGQIPYLIWWGVRGLQSSDGKNVLVAIVADPHRNDQQRYGLVVFAAPVSEGQEYKAYWVEREENMASYLISQASGTISIECFHEDGSEQTKELFWDKKVKRFKLT